MHAWLCYIKAYLECEQDIAACREHDNVAARRVVPLEYSCRLVEGASALRDQKAVL